jgi:hypothetical protein
MLKAAGVDRFSIARKLQELDPEQVENLQRIFAAERGIVDRRVEEVRYCELFLLIKTHSLHLEEALVPELPLGEQQLADLAAGPQGPFDDRAELLPEIFARSPIPTTRTLAAIALIRCGAIEGDPFDTALAALGAEEPMALEAALALGHWRTQLPPWAGRLDPLRLACVAAPGLSEPSTRQWAAVACSRLEGWLAELDEWSRQRFHARHAKDLERVPFDDVHEALREGLDHPDADLRFACAQALGDEPGIALGLDSDDRDMQQLARTYLASRLSPRVATILVDGPDDSRRQVLVGMGHAAAPPALVEPLVCAVERGDAEARGRAAWRLQGALTPTTVRRLVTVALRERDAEILRALLSADSLPEAEWVVRTILDEDLYELPQVSDGVVEAAGKGWISVEFLVSLLESTAGEARLRALLPLAEALLTATNQRPLLLALLRIALGPYSAETRSAALWTVSRSEDWSRGEARTFHFTAADARELLGSEEQFVEALVEVLDDEATLREVGYYEWLAALFKEYDPILGPTMTEDSRTNRALVDALVRVMSNDYWLYLRTAVAQFLGFLAQAPAHRDRIVAAMEEVRAQDVDYDLGYWLDRVLQPPGD